MFALIWSWDAVPVGCFEQDASLYTPQLACQSANQQFGTESIGSKLQAIFHCMQPLPDIASMQLLSFPDNVHLNKLPALELTDQAELLFLSYVSARAAGAKGKLLSMTLL